MESIPRIKEIRELPLDSLVIGKGQARTREVSAGIGELAQSIAKVGLLEPIIVAETSHKGKYEILTGQRRFLAHRELNLPTIRAAVLETRPDEITAKVISVTENLVRRDLNRRDLIDTCTSLFKKYGSARAVADETGLPYGDVLNYVKYDRLLPEVQKVVDSGEVDLKTALRAQDAAEVRGGDVPTTTIALCKEMKAMTGVQQRRLSETMKETAAEPIDEAIQAAKSGANISQIVVTLGIEQLKRLKRYADDEGASQNEAALTLIEEGLDRKGYKGV